MSIYVCLSLCAPCACPSPGKPEKGIVSSWIEIESYELSCRFWETNPGPLKQQQALLTVKPPLQSLLFPKVTYHLVVKDKKSSKTVQGKM